MAKVLITHAVPVNNGDAALMKSLHDSLKHAGHEVTVATYYYDNVKKKYPSINFIKEPCDFFVFRKLPFLKPLWIFLSYTFLRKYKEFDAYIACPGGYLNSYYNLENSLKAIQINSYKKKTAIFSQSVGPLSPKDQKYINSLSKGLKLLLVRDEKSISVLKQIGYQGKFLKTRDAAFLLKAQPIQERTKGRVAISVREWDKDSRSMETYQTMIEDFCIEVLKSGRTIEFLSTCQGIDGYKNDSLIAQKIANSLISRDDTYNQLIKLNTNDYNLDQLFSHLEGFEFVIGTRLHMCILSLLKGLPAFNISYEFKGKECYKYLGIESYSVDYNEESTNALLKLKLFIENFESKWPEVSSRIQEIKNEVRDDFNEFLKIMEL